MGGKMTNGARFNRERGMKVFGLVHSAFLNLGTGLVILPIGVLVRFKDYRWGRARR